MLTIDRFRAAYHVPEGAPDRDALQRRLDRLVRERLPSVIESELRQTSGDRDAVYVIRRLHLSLWLDALALADGDVADRWGKLVASALVRSILYGDGDNIRRFDDAAGFLAAFLGDLLDGRAWTQWAYDEFRLLEGLTPGQATAHLLASRPSFIVPVAERLSQEGKLGRLLAELSEADASAVWSQGLGFAVEEAAGLPADTPALLRDSRLPQLLSSGAFWTLSRLRLAAYLHLSVNAKRYEPDDSIATIANALARLQELMAARPAVSVWRALAAGEVDSPPALGGFLAGFAGSTAPARDWLVAALSAPAGPSRVAQLVRALEPSLPGDSSTNRTAEPHATASAFAGLALLLPAIRELRIYDELGRDAVYQVLLDAVGASYAMLAAADPGPQLLAGIEPRHAERARHAAVLWPAVSPDALGPDISSLPVAEEGHLPATLAILRRFASRLRGFEASSPEYLGRQFLRLAGHIEVDDQGLEVTLHQAPLGLVLQMNGLTGVQGRIPWLNGRMLTINLPQVAP